MVILDLHVINTDINSYCEKYTKQSLSIKKHFMGLEYINIRKCILYERDKCYRVREHGHSSYRDKNVIFVF